MANTLFESMTDKFPLTKEARLLHSTIDQLTSQIIGRLISERLIDYAGQPGETIEHAARVVADTLVSGLMDADIVALCQVHEYPPRSEVARHE